MLYNRLSWNTLTVSLKNNSFFYIFFFFLHFFMLYSFHRVKTLETKEKRNMTHIQSIMFTVKYFGATNTQPARMKLSTQSLFRNEKTYSKWVHFGNESNHLHENIIPLLEKAGFIVQTYSCNPENDFIMCKWDYETLEAFFGLKEEKAA